MSLFQSVFGKLPLGIPAALLLIHASSGGYAAALPGKPEAGPFLNGLLPSEPPRISSEFETMVAFTNLVFQNPMGLVPIPGSTKLAVWEREGKVWAFENDPGATEKTLLLDLSVQCQGWGAAGLFSIAFHPGFETNQWLFV